MKNKLFNIVFVFLLFFICLSVAFTLLVVGLELFFYCFFNSPIEYPEVDLYLRSAVASVLISIYYFWFVSKYK